MSDTVKEAAFSLIQSDQVPQDLKDLGAYIPYFQQYATNPPSELTDDQQFNAPILWVLAAREHNHESLLAAYCRLTDLFDRLALLGFDLWARRQVLDRLPGDLAVSAARCAIQHDDLELAISLLDKCRGLTWRQMLRTLPPAEPIEELVRTHPKPGTPLRGYLRALHISSINNRAKSKRDPKDTQEEIDVHVSMAQLAAKLLTQVRQLPGYEEFMSPDPIKNLRILARTAPVVILIPDVKHTHLILVRGSDASLEHRIIDGLTLESADIMAKKIKGIIRSGGRLARGHYEESPMEETLRDASQALLAEDEDSAERKFISANLKKSPATTQLQLNQILSTLWNTIGVAIKDILSLERSSNTAPKVYLYPSGPLTHLPIHAAGEYIRSGGESLLDYLVPSYITSLQNLSFSAPASGWDVPLRVLAISQPHTPGHNPLPAAKVEVEIIRKYVPPDQLFLAENEAGNKMSIISGSWEHSQNNPLVLHCACHAQQDPYDPLS
ncbi:hypothetical protein FRC08_011147, partial [Ceratobasidium sp. 394]